MMKKIPRFVAGSQPKATKFWNVAEVDDESGEITLYGDVCDRTPVDFWTGETAKGLYITPEGFLSDLEKVKNKKNVTVKINSCGGDLYTGIAIHNALKNLTAHKTVVIEGIAASAASVIAMAGDEVQVYPGSMLMIHSVSVGLMDYYNLDDLKKMQKDLDASERAVAQIYSGKTGLDVEKIRGMMSRETWFVGQEAVDSKFANTLIESDKALGVIELDGNTKTLLIAGIKHDITAFKNLPSGIAQRNATPPIAPNTAPNTPKPAQAAPAMTVDELRAKYPELVAQIEKAATESERERIKAIDEICKKPGAETLANDAKYKDICNAEKLALRILQAQEDAGATRLQQLKNDANNSGAADVTSGENSGPEAPGQSGKTDEAEISRLADIANKTRR